MKASRDQFSIHGRGTSVVATDVGGAREVIAEGETGYLVESGDDETMAARIINLLTHEARSRAMGERGGQIVCEAFSAEAQLVKTERLYDELIAGSHRGNADVGAAMKTVDPIA